MSTIGKQERELCQYYQQKRITQQEIDPQLQVQPIQQTLEEIKSRLSIVEKGFANFHSELDNALKKFEAKSRQKDFAQIAANKLLQEQIKLIESKLEERNLHDQQLKDRDAQKQEFSDQLNILQQEQNDMKSENKKLTDQLQELQKEFHKCCDLQITKSSIGQTDYNHSFLQENQQIINHIQQVKANLINDQHNVQYTNLQQSIINTDDETRFQIVQGFINEIYNQSWRKRSASGEFLKFIRVKYNLNELYRNYGIRQPSARRQLAQICNSFREVRGDGNCFYTAFGFQFLNILLYNYSLIEYQQFIKKMNQIITFKINYGEGKSIEAQGLQQYFWNEFKYRLHYLRNQNKDELIKHFQAYEQSDDNVLIDGCFYGLSTIFFRNLANYLIDRSDMKQEVFDQQNLLIWEEECNSNEVVIQELAKYLQVNVKLIFFDQGSFYLKEYSQEMKSQIILLIRPGHYNIGYPNIESNMEQY